jgi:hypothetical protein
VWTGEGLSNEFASGFVNEADMDSTWAAVDLRQVQLREFLQLLS